MVQRLKSGNSNVTIPTGNKMGRPTKFKPEYVRQAIKLCKLGATDAEMANFFDVNVVTFYRWTCLYPDFRSALKTPKESADDRVERSLYQRANGFWVDTEKLFVLNDKEFDGDGRLIRVTQRVHHEPTREYYPAEVGAIAWWQKNRQPEKWRDRHEVEGSIRNEHVFTFNIFENDLGRMKVIEGKKET